MRGFEARFVAYSWRLSVAELVIRLRVTLQPFEVTFSGSGGNVPVVA